MGKLLERLTAAGSEKQLTGRFGRWAQEITKAVDSLLGAGALGLAGAQYLQAAQVGANGLVQLNTDVIPNTIVAQQGIAYNTATGVATLTAGRTYSMTVEGYIVSFVGGAPPFFDLAWVDAGTNTPLTLSVAGTWIPVSDTANAAPSESLELIYTPSTNQNVKVRCVSGGGGTAQTVASHFWLTIKQIA